MNSVLAFFVSIFLYSSNLTTGGAEFRLLLMHNNDLHCRFVETNTYGAPCKRNQCYGGFARMKTAIKNGIEEADKDGVPHIVLNGGDTFHGTPYYNILKWRVVQPLLENLSIDAMSLGNHEFDDGVDNVSEFIKEVKIPVVCCNLNLTTEPRLNLPNLMPSKVLDVKGTKIGVIGYLTPQTMFMSRTENLRIMDEITCIQAEAKRLKKSGVKIIIAVGHAGFDRDVEIAREIPELSVVVGAHSHSLLYTPKDKPPSVEVPKESYPFIVTQKSGKIVPCVQAGAHTKYLGKLMLVFDDDGNVLSATGNTQLLDWTIPEDPEMKKLIDDWIAPLRPNMTALKGYTRVPLTLADYANSLYESNLANLITDAMVDYVVRKNHNDSGEYWTSASVAFMHGQGIRAQIQDRGSITLEDIMMILPFDNKICQLQYSGSTIKKALEYSVREESISQGYYLYFSGLKVKYDLARDVNNRVVAIEVLCINCSVPRYEVLEDDKIYSILIADFLMNGGDGFAMFKKEKINAVSLGIKHMDLLLDFIEREKIIYPGLDKRITVSSAFSNVLFERTHTTTFRYLLLISMFLFHVLLGKML